MNRRLTAAVAFVGLVAVPLALAQTAPSAPTPGPAVAAPSDSAGKTTTAARRDAGKDARNCLEFPTAQQIVACAEKYRGGKRGQ
jgi:hypothetical protein